MATRVEDRISVIPLHPVIGAEVRGVDLSRELDDATVAQIRDAFHAHAVLLFRDQDISEDDQFRFASLFGPIAERVHPPVDKRIEGPDYYDKMMLVTNRVDERGRAAGALGDGEMWFHTDKCYVKRPHRASMLYGMEIPSVGGHTRFASLHAAYDRIPDALKARLEGRMVMQVYDYLKTGRVDPNVRLEDILHYRQPIFVTNPGSGRRAVYVSRTNTHWIDGLDRAESDDILAQLFDICEDPANIHEHVWRPRDLVIWDNFACLHARTDWPREQPRALRRCTVEGEPLY